MMRASTGFVLAAMLGVCICSLVWAQPGAPALLPLESEPAPKLLAYPPIPDALARGVVIIQFRTENVRLMPVFGAKATEVTPRLGHLHVTVDNWQGTWAHTSNDPIILVGLPPGPHKILLEIAETNHKILAAETVSFTVPPKPADKAHGH
ncbi:DUF6130 family protein [Pseudoduganella sp. UC29_106]|uniref:DUF6130 family protein n=1 Tax=Pseudoduganella sp. UC29_106 TaxID=3374553 RepID=UPI003757147B